MARAGSRTLPAAANSGSLLSQRGNGWAKRSHPRPADTPAARLRVRLDRPPRIRDPLCAFPRRANAADSNVGGAKSTGGPREGQGPTARERAGPRRIIPPRFQAGVRRGGEAWNLGSRGGFG